MTERAQNNQMFYYLLCYRLKNHNPLRKPRRTEGGFSSRRHIMVNNKSYLKENRNPNCVKFRKSYSTTTVLCLSWSWWVTHGPWQACIKKEEVFIPRLCVVETKGLVVLYVVYATSPVKERDGWEGRNGGYIWRSLVPLPLSLMSVVSCWDCGCVSL